jgi:hypothetical protein
MQEVPMQQLLQCNSKKLISGWKVYGRHQVMILTRWLSVTHRSSGEYDAVVSDWLDW